MPCFHPLRAWRTQTGNVILAKDQPDSYQLSLPCGNCLGCRMARARSWALRCHLELQQHPSAAFATLTYDEHHLPATLNKRHLQLWLKRLRKSTAATANRHLRFFACGEYGERTHRPHYHAILYGLSEADAPLVQNTWTQGNTKTVTATPATIAYVAGYTAKKIGYKIQAQEERVDPETGEVYTWEPPFLQMSRRPGIGGHARQWAASWRSFAVHNGQKLPVPRFLHEAWKAQATDEEKEILIYEKTQLAKLHSMNQERLKAAEQIAINQMKNRAQQRKL